MPSKFPSCVHPNEFIADTFFPPVSGIPAFDTDCSRVRTSSQAPHRSSLCKHAVSFALLLVLSKPKHRFGFVRRNGGAAWSFPACPGSGMERVRLDVVRFPVLPFPPASQACGRIFCTFAGQKAEAFGRVHHLPHVLAAKPSAAGLPRTTRNDGVGR